MNQQHEEGVVTLRIDNNIISLHQNMYAYIFLGIKVFARNADSLACYHKQILFHPEKDPMFSMSKENYSEKEANRLHKESVDAFNKKVKEVSN